MNELIENLDHVTVESIRLVANPGAELNNCMNEAATVALACDCAVVLVHNDFDYLVDPDAIRATVTREAMGAKKT